jgi:hypothetical protein
MKKPTLALALVATLATPAVLPSAALAQRGDYRWNGDNNGNWDPSHSYHSSGYRERRLSRNDRVYRGSDGRYYCRRNDGTTGLVIGGVSGALLGNALGGGLLGTLAGGAGGALLGKSIDKGNVRCR